MSLCTNGVIVTPPIGSDIVSEGSAVFRTVAIPALASDVTVALTNPLPWTPSHVTAEIIGPDEIGINSKEVGAGGLTRWGNVTYHFRGVPSGVTHSLELKFYQ